MKADDKFPEEYLEEIREHAKTVRDAAFDLSSAVEEMLAEYPHHATHHEMRWWNHFAMAVANIAIGIDIRAEDFMEEEEGAE